MLRRFLYYIPNVGGANPKMLADRGLLSRFTNRIIASGGQGGNGGLIEHGVTATIEGPAIEAETNPARVGCIVAAGARPARYDPSQRWTELASGKGCVGLEDNTLPPGPADLEREDGVGGYMITLADGNEWRIPLIRKWDPQKLAHVHSLPEAIQGEKGAKAGGKYRFRSKVRPEFAELDGKAIPIFKALCQQATIEIDELFEQAAELLAVNYRLGVEEVALLGLFTVELAMKALGLAIDTPGMRSCGRSLASKGLVARQTARPVDPPGERVEVEKVESRADVSSPLSTSEAVNPLAMGGAHG